MEPTEPDNLELPEDENQGEPNLPSGEIGSGSGHRRKRIKIRKRIRIKSKPSSKKKAKKIAERFFWMLIVIAFVASLIVMIIQLDFKDEKIKQQLKKPVPGKSY